MLTYARRIVAWKWYATAVLATWVLAPEARRIVDWQTAYHPFSIFSVLPLMSLLPALLVFGTAWPRLGNTYRQVSLLWLIAFAYSYLIAYLSGAAFSAIYALAIFLIPPLLGFILAATGDEDFATVYERNANSILILAVITAVYGIYQFVSPPPWDVYWAQQANIEGSQGVTAAFNFRIFGTLNSTGPLSNYLDMAVLLNVPRLRLSRWWIGLAMVPCIIALLLTEVRAEWLALGLGIIIFAALSPKRMTALVTLGGVVVAIVAVGSVLLTVVNAEGANATMDTINARISTFGAIGNDPSAMSRQDQSTTAIGQGLSEPLGQGLGAMGGSLKLAGGPVAAIDNGFVARFFEMGVIGFVVYEIALICALIMTFRIYRRYVRGGNLIAANYAAVAFATQLVLYISEIDADHHSAMTALFFWFALFMASGFSAPSGERTFVPRREEAVALTPSRV